MMDQLETDLRSALAERADQVPAHAGARLSAIDYRPRGHRLRPPAAIGALAAGAAGTTAVAISLIGGATSAFAGWTPAPTPPAPGQVAAAMHSCDGQSPIVGLPLQLSDTRGPFTFQVYADARSSATCISGPSFTAVSGSSSSVAVTVPAYQVLLFSSHLTNRGGQSYSFAEGHTGAGVSAVTLVLDDGTRVQASVANGWFVAWWPGPHAVKAADLTTPSGERTQTIDLSSSSRCGTNVCTGGAVSTSGSGSVIARAGHGGAHASGYQFSGSTVGGSAAGSSAGPSMGVAGGPGADGPGTSSSSSSASGLAPGTSSSGSGH
jgi:hypothetical protein